MPRGGRPRAGITNSLDDAARFQQHDYRRAIPGRICCKPHLAGKRLRTPEELPHASATKEANGGYTRTIWSAIIVLAPSVICCTKERTEEPLVHVSSVA